MNLTYPAFYDMHGIPVRKLAENKLEEKMLPSGKWETFNDPERFGTEAHRVSRQEFEELVLAFTEVPEKAAPTLPAHTDDREV